MMKKQRSSSIGSETELSNLNEDMLFEILKHVDAPTLAKASCVNKKWKKTSNDERLWEIICTRHWVNIGCPEAQVRSVVLAFGGFRLLHSLYLRPVLKATAQSQNKSSTIPTKWGKDEVHLSLSLLSIRYYEMMDCNYKGRQK
ncbi:F-box protein gid2 [Thalictrum thalictroides]|uniref:F-box protein GID2 n=1 Tax=Thalictrum thalictroides TaxID=46969 RepID=A0A7J6UZG5_THATH|nr:F-box protein gid2 [Thalictrum thalictroides]